MFHKAELQATVAVVRFADPAGKCSLHRIPALDLQKHRILDLCPDLDHPSGHGRNPGAHKEAVEHDPFLVRRHFASDRVFYKELYILKSVRYRASRFPYFQIFASSLSLSAMSVCSQGRFSRMPKWPMAAVEA